MKDIVLPLRPRQHEIAISNSRESAYRAIIKYLVEEQECTICGLLKTLRGNAHDEDFEDYYTVVGNGGAFKEFFEAESKAERTLYRAAPKITFIDELTEDEIDKWCQPIGLRGRCEDGREVFVLWPSGEPKVYRLGDDSHITRRASDDEVSQWENSWETCWVEFALTELRSCMG